MAGTHHDSQEITQHINTHSNKNRPKDYRLTDAGYEVMEHILGEEGLIQSSKVQLQNTSNRIHVMVILVSCQWILAFIRTSRKQTGNAVKHLKTSLYILLGQSILPLSKAFLMSLTST